LLYLDTPACRDLAAAAWARLSPAFRRLASIPPAVAAAYFANSTDTAGVENCVAVHLNRGMRQDYLLHVLPKDKLVVAPDAADTLYVSFFIDYDKNPDVSYGSTVITGSGGTVRGSASLTLRTDQVGIPLFTVGDHAVDVVVSDEPLQSGRRPRPRPVGSVVDGGPVNSSFAVMHTWFIKPSGYKN
jgi:hypothetical protein